MFQQVVELVPDSFRGYSSLGATHFMKDQTDQAIAAFEKSRRSGRIRRRIEPGNALVLQRTIPAIATMFRQALALEKGSYQVSGNSRARSTRLVRQLTPGRPSESPSTG